MEGQGRAENESEVFVLVQEFEFYSEWFKALKYFEQGMITRFTFLKVCFCCITGKREFQTAKMGSKETCRKACNNLGKGCCCISGRENAVQKF